MSYLSEQEFDTQMEKIKKKNESIERKRKLKEEKSKYKFQFKLPFKLPATSKLVVLVVFLMCIEVLIFSQYAMIKLGDISAMYTLIGVPVTLVPVVISYMHKARAENTASGLVYEKTMFELNQTNSNIENVIEYDEESVG